MAASPTRSTGVPTSPATSSFSSNGAGDLIGERAPPRTKHMGLDEAVTISQGGAFMRERAASIGAQFLLIGSTALLMLGGCSTLTVVPAERLEEQRLTPAAEPVAHIYAAN